jgi:hypothetical protein
VTSRSLADLLIADEEWGRFWTDPIPDLPSQLLRMGYLRSNVAGTWRYTPSITTQTVYVPGAVRLETARL